MFGGEGFEDKLLGLIDEARAKVTKRGSVAGAAWPDEVGHNHQPEMNYQLAILGICRLLSAGCSPPHNPRNREAFNPAEKPHIRLGFAVGDRFETLKAMFLVRSTDKTLWIRPPHSNSPTLEAYHANPDGTQYDVKRLLPAGTRIEIVAINDSFMGGAIHYFKIDGDTTWVKAYFEVRRSEKVNKPSLTYMTYVDFNHGLYRKIN